MQLVRAGQEIMRPYGSRVMAGCPQTAVCISGEWSCRVRPLRRFFPVAKGRVPCCRSSLPLVVLCNPLRLYYHRTTWAGGEVVGWRFTSVHVCWQFPRLWRWAIRRVAASLGFSFSLPVAGDVPLGLFFFKKGKSLKPSRSPFLVPPAEIRWSFMYAETHSGFLGRSTSSWIPVTGRLMPLAKSPWGNFERDTGWVGGVSSAGDLARSGCCCWRNHSLHVSDHSSRI